MKIKFLKTHPDAQLPKRNHDNRPLEDFEYSDRGLSPTYTWKLPLDMRTADSGYDIFAAEDTVIPSESHITVPTGIQVAYITPGYWFRVESRSGLSFKAGILAHPGVIDNQYRGDLGVCLYNHSHANYTVKKGDRIAQLVVYPVIEAEVEWAEEVHETKRGDKGFGSSGS
jgi:dUTP pyrophosphatase